MIKKKSNSKKADTTTKKTKLRKQERSKITARDKKIQKQQPWITETEFPLEFRNQFPTIIEEIDTFIEICKVQAERLVPSFELEEDSKLFKAYRYGWAVGWYEGTEAVLNKIKNIKAANEEPIEEPKVEEGQNGRFDSWWANEFDEENTESRHRPMTYEDLDGYQGIAFGAWLDISFEDFDKFVHNYCFSRKRVGFWLTNEWGTMTWHFDCTNQAELHELSRETKIKKAKKLLETEGIIEPVEPMEFGKEEPPKPDYS
jgi:hypothetical protein